MIIAVSIIVNIIENNNTLVKQPGILHKGGQEERKIWRRSKRQTIICW